MSLGLRKLAGSLFLVASLSAPMTPANAQVVGIEAVVNEEIISALDVENRLRFNLVSANLRDNSQTRRRLKPQVLQSLVDEKLQMQEARRLNISIGKSEIEEAERILEAQNNLPSGGLVEFLRSRGLDEITLMARIEAEIAWGKVIRRRILPRIDISDEEVEEVYARLQSRHGTQQRLVSEIFLAIDRPEQSEDVHQLALRLVGQLRNGSPFTAVARQFSQGVTSRSGGDVGWIGEGELPAELERVLAGLSTGEVSEPISSPGGYYILHLRDQRRMGEASALDTRINLKQILIPLRPSTPQRIVEARMADARRISEQIRGCDTFDSYGQSLEIGQPGDLGTVRLGDVPQYIRDAIGKLEVGQASEPLRMDQGIRILVVCDRNVATAALPSREAIHERLARQRLDMMARRYLRDLRRDAVIDTR
ncbi:MAG: peptidylprolyl isomerase [Rhodospirillaceae bacterium]|nr:peptidylprolyl isomerase [Rhodospirillaceae bacterium]